MTWQSPLRDLAKQLSVTAQNHVAYSQAIEIVSQAVSYLNAIAYIEEIHRRDNMIDIQKRPVIKVSQACYDEIRNQLLALGDGAIFESRGDRRLIDMSPGQVVIETTINASDNKNTSPHSSKREWNEDGWGEPHSTK